MSYKPRYNIELGCNPTIPGVSTIVEQTFDGTQLTDRYIKQLTNAIRRYGVLPRFGGMFSTAGMLANHLGVRAPLGVMLRKWSEHCYVSGPKWDEWPAGCGDRALWQEMVKLSDVRAQVAYAASPPNPWAGGEQTSMWQYETLYLAGWKPGELTPLRLALREHVLNKIPGYFDDMEKIATFLESRPKFVVQQRKTLQAVTNNKDRRGAIVK